MHGMIALELRKYVDARLPMGAWSRLMKDAGKSGTYLATQAYPDQEIAGIVGAAAKLAGKSVPAVLEDFGEFIVPDLVKTYGAFIRMEWKALDLLEHAEKSMHAAVRIQTPGAAPPKLACARVSPNEILITYSSPRKMCGVAKGIIKGIAKHYNERLVVSETSCMSRGDGACKISVKKALG